ncbi:MAG: lysine--tRNA ligase [Candidatus Helarchaeota archaeon]|nr:lysine--tRNA ligase [Candidatus Helarchaeota archaeon]
MAESKTHIWADKLAKKLIEREKYNYIDKKIPKTPHSIKSSTSISGVPHIGNACDVFRAEAVVKALRDSGEKNIKFFWVTEDSDPFRKVPAGIPKEFKKYLGKPVSDLPCPEGCCDNYSDHFVNLFVNSLKDNFGVKMEVYSTTKYYRAGKFYNEIKIALEKVKKLREIINKYRNPANPLPENWIPWQPICDNCGKIITTRMKKIDGDNVTYSCEDYQFKHATVKGCGHEGVSDIKKGFGKLGWKTEWAAEWHIWDVTFEPFGKEHGVNCPHEGYGPVGVGSFWVAGTISELIYDWPEPCPTKASNDLQPYEYILIGKEKMSASKGNIISTWDWPSLAPPETLKLFFLRKPNSQTNIMSLQKLKNMYKMIDDHNDIPKLIFDFEKLTKIYYGLEKDERKDYNIRLYELIQIKKISDKMPYFLPFRFAIDISQLEALLPHKQILEKSRDMISRTYNKRVINGEIKTIINDTLNRARYWINNFAPEKLKFDFSEEKLLELKNKFTADQKSVLIQVEKLVQKDVDWDDQELQNQLFTIGKSLGNPKKFFETIYLALIGRKSGPRLAPLLLLLDKNWIINRFQKITN